MKTILAIDQSTSATKALLFNTAGELLDKTSVSHRQIYPQPGWVEHDASEIYYNTIEAIKSLLEKNSRYKNDVLCLSITNQRETIVVFDKQTGEPLYNAIVWQCRRGEAICSQLVAEGYSDMVQRKTGLKIDTYFPASKLKWLFENRADIHRQVLDGKALIGTIDAYLVYRLTGGDVFATDHTNASRTLLFDISKFNWDEELCQLFGVPISSLPESRESKGIYGETMLGGELDKPIPICGVMGDSQAALFGQRCFEPGTAKVTFGSGSSVLLNIGEQLRLSSNGVVTTIAWVYDGNPTYAFEGIINFTGATIAWLQEQLQLISSPQETEKLAMAVEDNGGVYLVPAFVGLSAPYWRPDARAAIIGLTPASTKNHVVRAALESIAYIVKDVLVLMSKEAGVTLQHINADGGAVKNRFLMQFVADMTQLTVRASSLPELSALGAVLSGALGLAIYSSPKDLQQLPAHSVDYEPLMNLKQAQDLYTGWQRAVEQVLLKSHL